MRKSFCPVFFGQEPRPYQCTIMYSGWLMNGVKELSVTQFSNMEQADTLSNIRHTC